MTPSAKLRHCAVAATVLVLSVNVAHAQHSTFETGLEGWTLIGSGLLEHDNRDGGNPGGYARFEDAPGPGGDGWLIAPARFLGDWTDLKTSANSRGIIAWSTRVTWETSLTHRPTSPAPLAAQRTHHRSFLG